MPQQREIVKRIEFLLTKVDTLEAENNKQKELLEQMKESMLREAFR
jgi:restriction endonuclease S subunit